MQFSTSSCRKIRANLQKNSTDISISTVSDRLSKEFGLKFYNPATKLQYISHLLRKKKTLSFTNKHLHWTVEKWETVILSDESTVQQIALRKKHVRRQNATD